MEPKPTTVPEVLEVLDNVLSAALKEVRRARARLPVEAPDGRRGRFRGTSHISLCLDVIEAAGHPVHANALVEALVARGVHVSRDSLVSALSKRLAPRGPFVRTAANTFGLAARDTEGAP